MSHKEAANNISLKAKELKIRFPSIWDDAKILQTCGATMMTFRLDDGFDDVQTLNQLIETYGVHETKDTIERKRSIDIIDVDENIKTEDTVSKLENVVKKVKKSETVLNEKNRAIAEAVREMAEIYFKNGDSRKGGVFSKAAKSIRETDAVIANKKTALALKGIGKGIAGYIEEKIETGNIKKLEELRAGIA